MTIEQARTALRLADGLPQEIGWGRAFLQGGGPCDAVGHMAVALGWTDSVYVYKVEHSTGLSVKNIVDANDGASRVHRRVTVVREVERQVREAGYDPQALRREVSPDA